MSTEGNAALALALGVGGGVVAWHLTRKDKKKPGGGGAPATADPPSTSTAPPRVAGPCSLKLDAAGLTADGDRVDVPSAVARCKPAGKAELALASSAPATIYMELATALQAAAVPLAVKHA